MNDQEEAAEARPTVPVFYHKASESWVSEPPWAAELAGWRAVRVPLDVWQELQRCQRGIRAAEGTLQSLTRQRSQALAKLEAEL